MKIFQKEADMPTPTSVTQDQSKPTNTPCAQALQIVLTDTYGLSLATHNYHWNVEGRDYVALHALFGKQYRELIMSIDRIAERIRSLGTYTLPFDGNSSANLSKTIVQTLNKKTSADTRADQMIQSLIILTNKAVESCQSAKEESRDAEDDESEILMIEQITAHQRSLWKLNSVSK